LPSRCWGSRLAALGAAAAVAALGTWIVYGHTLQYSFHYDDYHFVRPYALEEVRAAFHGPWDPSGVELPFYRPLTIAFFAGRFELFGLDARAHHAASLALFALAALLTGAFVWQLSRRLTAAAFAALVFATHPSMPYALAAWITNQMHLLETLTVLAALCWWFAVRARHAGWWLPLLLMGTAAFLIKEDGVMLLPAIAALHGLRRRLIEPALAPVPRTFLALAALLIAALLLARHAALEGLESYAVPTAAGGWRNFWWGLDRVFRLVPPDRPWQPVASWFAMLLPVAGLLAWRRTAPEVRFVLGAGAILATAFNVPFVFTTKLEQLHLVATGAVLVLAGSAACLMSALTSRAWRAGAGLVLAGGIASFATVARDISTDFAPDGPIALSLDEIVRQWAAVPEELREYLRRKPDAIKDGTFSPNPLDTLAVVAFGLHPPERSPDGVTYRWMAQPWIELHIAPDARLAEIPLRHEFRAFREPARARVFADGRLVDTLLLADGSWRVTRFALLAAGTSRRSHRVRLTIPHAWQPSSIIPGSTDERTLGLQVGEILIR
jgi:hypothetical protein